MGMESFNNVPENNLEKEKQDIKMQVEELESRKTQMQESRDNLWAEMSQKPPSAETEAKDQNRINNYDQEIHNIDLKIDELSKKLRELES